MFRFDADAIRALLLYGGATLLLGFACARDLERNLSVPSFDTGQEIERVVGR
jgi:hypothetical protein